jgi:hypothetical protein
MAPGVSLLNLSHRHSFVFLYTKGLIPNPLTQRLGFEGVPRGGDERAYYLTGSDPYYSKKSARTSTTVCKPRE